MAAQVYPLLARDIFATYGYFIVDEETGCGFLVDPGAQPQLFLQAILQHSWNIEAILLTHGHFDHTGAVNALRDELGIPVYAHESAGRYLTDAQLNLSAGHGRNVTVVGAQTFADGDRIATSDGSVALDVLHIPGHTDDSCVFYSEPLGMAFVGDTVYEGGPGLTVFPTGNLSVLRTSIQNKLLTLPDDTLLLSGHSRPTTVEQLRSVVR